MTEYCVGEILALDKDSPSGFDDNPNGVFVTCPCGIQVYCKDGILKILGKCKEIPREHIRDFMATLDI